MDDYELVKECIQKNNGYITTNELLTLNVSKPMIPNLVKKGLIRKVHFGLYMGNNYIEDEYYILQQKYPRVIFSHLTALHLLKLSPVNDKKIHITIERKEKVRGDYHVHYNSKNYIMVGITNTLSPYGNPIRIYNAERCICDLFRDKYKIDPELQQKILMNYFKSKEKDTERLLEYAKALNVYDKINKFIKIMQKYEK